MVIFRIFFNMIKLLLLFFALFVAYWGIKLFIAARNLNKQAKEFPGFAEKKNVNEGNTVKCEKCASYVASELSISGSDNGRTVYFCSKECKKAFFNER